MTENEVLSTEQQRHLSATLDVLCGTSEQLNCLCLFFNDDPKAKELPSCNYLVKAPSDGRTMVQLLLGYLMVYGGLNADDITLAAQHMQRTNAARIPNSKD